MQSKIPKIYTTTFSSATCKHWNISRILTVPKVILLRMASVHFRQENYQRTIVIHQFPSLLLDHFPFSSLPVLLLLIIIHIPSFVFPPPTSHPVNDSFLLSTTYFSTFQFFMLLSLSISLPFNLAEFTPYPPPPPFIFSRCTFNLIETWRVTNTYCKFVFYSLIQLFAKNKILNY